MSAKYTVLLFFEQKKGNRSKIGEEELLGQSIPTTDRERTAAPVVLISCGDFRMQSSRDRAIIEAEINRVATMMGVCSDGESVRFDALTVPGPVRVLVEVEKGSATIGCLCEAQVILVQAELFLDLHGNEVIILATHFDCGREGSLGKEEATLKRHLVRALHVLRRHFPRHMVVGMYIEVDDTRTVSATALYEEPRGIQDAPGSTIDVPDEAPPELN